MRDWFKKSFSESDEEVLPVEAAAQADERATAHLAEQARRRAAALRRIAAVDKKYKAYMAGGKVTTP